MKKWPGLAHLFKKKKFHHIGLRVEAEVKVVNYCSSETCYNWVKLSVKLSSTCLKISNKF